MDKCEKTAALYVASLKALALIHTHNHWTTKGAAFYGDHLLFERIYDSALQDLDKAAEEFVGVFGDTYLDYSLQADLLHKVLERYGKFEGSPLQMSLAVEKDFLKFNEEAFRCFEDEDKLTLGMSDVLPAIASSRESAVFLLQQALDGNEE